MCTIKYMIRKIWGGFVEQLPGCGLCAVLTAIAIAIAYAFRAISEWLGVEPELLLGICLLVAIIAIVTCGLVKLYREAKRHCATENEPVCEHEFFKCRIPPGAGGGAISHWVCKKCRWDESNKAFVSDEIWHEWIVPQLEKKRRAKC